MGARTPRYDANKGNTDMETETTKKLFTVDEYYRMAEVGILGPEDRVELIDGEILRMSPIGVRHAGCVNATHEAFTSALRGRAVTSVQNPVQLTNYTEPQPDLLLLKSRKDFYRAKKVRGEDVLLVVEVADTTLRYDRDVKLRHYAAADVREVWIEDLQHNRLLVFRDPAGKSYKTALTLTRDQSVSPLAFADVTFNVRDFLG